jgi:hypothetical protein
MKARRWAPIAFGAAVLVVFIGVSVGVFSVAWMREHLAVEAATEASADSAFAELRQRHGSKAPLIEMRGTTLARRNQPAAGAPRAELSRLHLLAWDPREQRLSRLELPFWLLRLKKTPIQFGLYASGLNELGISLTIDEIERYGPGIIVDVSRDGSERALIWVK